MHYPLVSAAKMPSPANARRWQRHEIDLPVHVVLHNEVSRMLVPGRGTEISEGGMALYAGVHLKPNELMEIAFLTPCPAQVTGIIRNRTGYCFGLEFLIALPAENEVARWPQLAAVGLEQGDPKAAGPLAPATAKGFDNSKAAQNGAADYGMPAQVVMADGNPAEPLKAADGAVLLFLQSHYVYLRQRGLEMKRLRKEIKALRCVALLLAEIDEQPQKRVQSDPHPVASAHHGASTTAPTFSSRAI